MNNNNNTFIRVYPHSNPSILIHHTQILNIRKAWNIFVLYSLWTCPLKGVFHNSAKQKPILLFVVLLNLVSREKINSPQISRIKALPYSFFSFMRAFNINSLYNEHSKKSILSKEKFCGLWEIWWHLAVGHAFANWIWDLLIKKIKVITNTTRFFRKCINWSIFLSDYMKTFWN